MIQARAVNAAVPKSDADALDYDGLFCCYCGSGSKETVMTNDADKARLKRWKIFFEISLVILLAITAMAWTWREVILVILLAGTLEWFISEANRKLDAKSSEATISWFKRRLELVDPHWQEDLMKVTPDAPHLRPPAEEIVCRCPKCNRAIKRRELDHRFNGGWSASHA